MSDCEWGYDNCKNIGTSKCFGCLIDGQYFEEKEVKIKKTLNKRQQKQDKRQGSGFEYKNHMSNTKLLKDSITSSMTLNSGATVIEKGDEQIRGLVNIMEELKTRTVEQAPGKKNFTIQEKWLSKLKFEAKKENMDFYYLKFSFNENDQQVYVIIEQEEIMSMVKTIVEDRKSKKILEKEKDILIKKQDVLLSEIKKLRSELALAKALVEEGDWDFE